MKRLAVLISGRGSNFLSIAEAIRRRELDAEIVLVVSNRADAPGASRSKELGFSTHVIEHRDYSDRLEHEKVVRKLIDEARADFVVMAGYMRLLSHAFVEAYRNRILNIHPSLLPSFPGVDAQAQAISHGVKVAGCTVHFVDETLDGGPIIVQRFVSVTDDDDAETLSAKILVEEHKAYVEALRRVCGESYRIEGRRVVFGG